MHPSSTFLASCHFWQGGEIDGLILGLGVWGRALQVSRQELKGSIETTQRRLWSFVKSRLLSFSFVAARLTRMSKTPKFSDSSCSSETQSNVINPAPAQWVSPFPVSQLSGLHAMAIPNQSAFLPMQCWRRAEAQGSISRLDRETWRHPSVFDVLTVGIWWDEKKSKIAANSLSILSDIRLTMARKWFGGIAADEETACDRTIHIWHQLFRSIGDEWIVNHKSSSRRDK